MCGIVGLLSVVGKVLDEEGQHGRVGVLLVLAAYAVQRALLVVNGVETLLIALFGKDAAAILRASRLEQGASVDVIHHLLIDGLDVAVGRLFPEGDVLIVQTQHHVAAHEEQRMLTAQTRGELGLSVVPDREQRATVGSQLFLGGVVPRALGIAGAVQVTVQLVHIAEHQLVALLACRFPDGFGIIPAIDGAVGIDLPVLQRQLVDVGLEALGRKHFEDVVVVCAAVAAGQHADCCHQQQVSDDRSFHSRWVYNDECFLLTGDR